MLKVTLIKFGYLYIIGYYCKPRVGKSDVFEYAVFECLKINKTSCFV